jgi:hypothetical protein
MLGSSFDGERLNALGHLQRMAENYKVPIYDLLLVNEQGTREAQRPCPAEPDPDAPKLPLDWRELFHKAQQLNCSRFFLAAWESNFVADLIARGTRFPSLKQAAVIARIREKAATFRLTASANAEDCEDDP